MDSEVSKKLKQNKGIGQEENAKPGAEAGLWRHPESKQEAATKYDPLYGNAMSEAFARAGFVRVGNVPVGYEVVAMPAAAPSVGDDDLKGIMARLNALEDENKQLREAQSSEPAEVAPETKTEKKGKL